MSIIKANRIQNLAGQTLQNVVQVVSTEYAGPFGTTSNSYVDVYNVIITPRFQTSKFWVFASVMRGADAWNASLHYTGLARTVSGTTTNLTEVRSHNYAGSAGDTNSNPFSVPIQFFDTPNTTSAITYSVRIATPNTSFISTVNSNPGSSSSRHSFSHITVMEIAQ